MQGENSRPARETVGAVGGAAAGRDDRRPGGRGLAWLARAHGIADTCWLVSATFGLGYALWSAADAIRHGRLGVDVLALPAGAPRTARRYR